MDFGCDWGQRCRIELRWSDAFDDETAKTTTTKPQNDLDNEFCKLISNYCLIDFADCVRHDRQVFQIYIVGIGQQLL